MNFSNQLKKYRKENKFSQETLAEKIYVSRQTISNWENDKTYPDIQHLITLSLLFDVSVDELLKGDVEKMKHTVEGKKQLMNSTQSLVMSLAALSILMVMMFFVEEISSPTIYAVIFISFVLMASTIRIEYLKRKFNIDKYQDIISYMEDQTVSDKKPLPLNLSLILWVVSFIIMAIIVYLIVR